MFASHALDRKNSRSRTLIDSLMVLSVPMGIALYNIFEADPTLSPFLGEWH